MGDETVAAASQPASQPATHGSTEMVAEMVAEMVTFGHTFWALSGTHVGHKIHKIIVFYSKQIGHKFRARNILPKTVCFYSK